MIDYNRSSDSDLLVAMQADNTLAFTAIHDRYYGILYSHAFRRLPDREEVNDILQELFLFLWNNRKKEFTGHLSGYLYTSTRNRILNVYKYKKIRSDYIDSLQEFLAHEDPIADEIIREKELIVIIEQEVLSLPAQMRVVFEMSRNLHKSYQEIADELGISPLTVKKQVYNSLKILRSKLGPHFHTIFL